MALPTTTVLPYTGAGQQTVFTPNSGRQAAASSQSIVLSNEDSAALASQTTLAAILTALGVALPLPTGAATQTTLAAVLAQLVAGVPVTSSALPTGAATQTTLASCLTALQAALPAGTNTIGNVTVNDPAGVSGSAITAADASSTTATNFLGQAVNSGANTAGSVSSFVVTGSSIDRFMLTTTNFNGTVVVEKSSDGSNWVSASVQVPGVAALQSTFIFPGTAQNVAGVINLAGVANWRVRCTAFTSGSLAVASRAGYGIDHVSIPGGTIPTAGPAGGSTPGGFIADGTTYQGVIKGSPGTLYSLSVSNTTVNNLYLRVYNKTINPVPGTDTPLYRFVIPPGGRECQLSAVGTNFTTGIAWTFTSGSFADTDVTPVVVNTGAINTGSK